jgi:hypothetical protein
VVGIGKVGGGFFAVFATLDYLTRYGLGYMPVLPHALRWVPGSIVVGATFGFFFYRIMEKHYKQWISEQ